MKNWIDEYPDIDYALLPVAAFEHRCFMHYAHMDAREAGGLLNLFGEGISPASAAGLIAGEAAAESLSAGELPGLLYRRRIETEKRKTVDTFHYGKLLCKENDAFTF